MSMQTNQTLTPRMISKLQELIQANIDSRDGLRHASEAVDDLTLQCAFENIAIERDSQADELARFVAWSGEYPRREGSVLAAVYRGWNAIREMVSTDNRHAVLVEAEAAEDSLKSAYHEALGELIDSPVRDVILRQAATVEAAHNRIRDLRDCCEH